MPDIYEVLTALDIPYEKHEHPAVFTVEESMQYDRGLDAGKSKNLFLRNKKGDTHYLIVVEAERRVDLKHVGELLGAGRLSFASAERMQKYLGLTPGSVSPFGLINDTDHEVKVIVDEGLMQHEKVAFHPNVNTATLVISREDFRKFLERMGNSVTYMELE